MQRNAPREAGSVDLTGPSRTAIRRRRTHPPIDADALERAKRTRPRARADGSGRCPPPSLELWARHLRYAAQHDPADLEALVLEYEGLAAGLAARMYRRGEPLDELRQVAMEALVRLLQSFDPTRGIPFPGYATPSIIGRLKRHYRDQGWAIRVGRDEQSVIQVAGEVRSGLRAAFGREPSDGEVAERMGRPVADVRSASVAAQARVTTPLDAPGDRGTALYERLGADDPALRSVEHRIDLTRAITRLGRRECDLLQLYYWQHLSQSAIAERYGTSQMQISRWLAGALAQLRSAMAA